MACRHRALKVFGSNLRIEREHKKLTQEELAELADLDPSYISGIERGVRNPTILSVLRIASALDMTISDLTRSVKG